LNLRPPGYETYVARSRNAGSRIPPSAEITFDHLRSAHAGKSLGTSCPSGNPSSGPLEATVGTTQNWQCCSVARTAMRSKWRARTRPSGTRAPPVVVKTTSAYPRAGTQMSSRTGGRAPPGSTLPRRIVPALLSVNPTGLVASRGALRITAIARRPRRPFPYTRRTPAWPGVVQPSAVTPCVAHANR
jgi:hypothetical protein